ncbi:MAG: ThuA domain-containing protein [Candidatus Solibacter sp.]
MRTLALCGILTAFAIGSLSAQPGAQPASPDQKTILFVAGPKDHGAVDRHEYQKDLLVLKYCIDNMGLKNVRTRLYNGKAPDVRFLKTASAIVLEGSGDRTPEETHPLLPQDAVTDHKSYDPYTTDRLKQIDEMMKAGLGIVSIHYSTWINNELGGKYWLDWLGGVAPWGQDSAKVLVAKWSAAPVKSDHPILRGVTPWAYDQEEFFFKETMPTDPRRTPLLQVTRPAGGDVETVSWAVERPGGGRGFVFTGSDFHKNMEIEQHRRILVNGVLWAAKLEVPQGGASCSPPAELLK